MPAGGQAGQEAGAEPNLWGPAEDAKRRPGWLLAGLAGEKLAVERGREARTGAVVKLGFHAGIPDIGQKQFLNDTALYRKSGSLRSSPHGALRAFPGGGRQMRERTRTG